MYELSTLGDALAVSLARPRFIGTIAAVVATRTISGLLFDTGPADLSTFLAVIVVLIAAATLAAWLPARRAAHVDPVVTMRAE
jgi:putative ABC transport system permease protein